MQIFVLRVIIHVVLPLLLSLAHQICHSTTYLIFLWDIECVVWMLTFCWAFEVKWLAWPLQALELFYDISNIAAEITHKLRADADNRILVKLAKFFQLPELIEAGITLKEARKRITPAPIHMVSNVNSKSSLVRMVIAPHQPYKVTRQSINDALHAGHHGLPSIQETLLRYQLSVSIALADLSCYY